MTGRLKVHFGTLAEATDELESVVKVLEEHLSHLDEAVHRLAETWEGEAHEAFHTYYRQWHGVSANLHRSLRALHNTVRTAHGNYSAARAANLRMWGA